MSGQRQFRPNLFERLGAQWCRIMHDSATWPLRGRYRCRACGRSYLVPWASGLAAEPIPADPYSLKSGT